MQKNWKLQWSTSAEELYQKGTQEFNEYGIKMHPNGGYDVNSEAFKNGDARLKKDGVSLDGRCKVARKIKKKYNSVPI